MAKGGEEGEAVVCRRWWLGNHTSLRSSNADVEVSDGGWERISSLSKIIMI